MHPGVIGALIFVLLNQKNNEQIQTSDPQQLRPLSAALVFAFLAVSIFAMSSDMIQQMLLAMVGFTELASGGEPFVETHPVLLILLLLLIPILFPWMFTRWYLIPRGEADAARILTLWAGWAWNGDRFGGSVAAGVCALLRRQPFDGSWFTAQESQLAKSSLRAGGILAHGLAAAGRGDLATARILLASAGGLHKVFTPPLARMLAREWLMVEALERGDWRRIHALGQEAGPRTILSRFLSGAAARHLPGIPYRFPAFRLRTWWVLGMRWRILHPLLKDALEVPDRPLPLRSPPMKRQVSTLAETLVLYREILLTPPDRRAIEDLIDLGIAWDSLFEDPVRLAAAIPSLQQTGPAARDGLAASLRGQVVDDLVAILEGTDIPSEKFRTWGRILQDVADRRRNARLVHLEDVATRLKRRVDARKVLPPIDEWLEYLQVRAAHEKVVALGGLEVRRLAFAHSYFTISHMAVWLYDKRDERPMAHAMFRWMFQEATALDDAEAIKSQAHNVSLCPDHVVAPPVGWR